LEVPSFLIIAGQQHRDPQRLGQPRLGPVGNIVSKRGGDAQGTVLSRRDAAGGTYAFRLKMEQISCPLLQFVRLAEKHEKHNGINILSDAIWILPIFATARHNFLLSSLSLVRPARKHKAT
jgi:hypothetical protein